MIFQFQSRQIFKSKQTLKFFEILELELESSFWINESHQISQIMTKTMRLSFHIKVDKYWQGVGGTMINE